MAFENLLTKRKIEKLAHQFYGDPTSISLESISSQIPDVFISYSHEDLAFVKDVIAFLFYAKGGLRAYADRLDATMNHEPNLDTASTIKKKILSSQKVIFVASYESLKSPWCNWELGLSDGLKDFNNVAILSAKTNNGRWHKNEYLLRYPLITFNEKSQSFEVVSQADGSKATLIDWILNNK